MKSIVIGLALSCLMLLSACSGKVRYEQKTEYLVCGNVKALAATEQHPSRQAANENGDLLDLIDQYDIKLTTQNDRMGEIRDEIDSCAQRAKKLSNQEQP